MAACVPISNGFTASPSSLGCFTMRELEQLLLLELGQTEAAKLLWPWAPFEYLARRRGKQQLIVDEVPVADLLPHIPYLLEYCSHLIDTACGPARAQEAAKKAAVFTARLLDVLLFPGVQNRLGGRQQLQPTIELLQVAVPAFQQRSAAQQVEDSTRNQQPAAAASAAATGLTAATASTAGAAAAAGDGSNLEVVDTPFACPEAAAAVGRASAGAAAASAAAASRPAAAGADTGMHLAALLAAIAPYVAQPGSPLPADFGTLLAQWARLVYGEVADHASIQVSALILYHWRTLLRFLRLCLQGTATLGSSAGPMLVSTAVGHMQGLLHLLHHEAMRALFTPQQYRRLTDRLVALKTLLRGLPQTPTGHAAAVGSFCSAAVAALMEVGPHGCSLPPMPAGSAAVVSTGAPAQAVERSSIELGASQQQLLSALKDQLHQAGTLSPQHLDAVQEVLAILRRQVMKETDSDRFEVSGVNAILVAFIALST